MYKFLVALILIDCVLLAIVVLVQNSKGGGLAANFSAPNQFMGVRRTADFLEKATWWMAIILVVLSLATTASIPHRHVGEEIETSVTVDNNVLPATPAPTANTNVAPAPSESDAQ